MSLLDTIKGALGLQRALKVQDATAPLAFSESAKKALQALPEGHGLHLSLKPIPAGYAVEVEPGPSQGPPPEELAPLPLTGSDYTFEQLRGLTMDHGAGGWRVSLQLEVRARETPNPDSRLYLTDHQLAGKEPIFFSDQAELPPIGNLMLAIPGVRSILLRDHTVTVERVPDHPWTRIDQAVDQTLRTVLLACHQPLSRADVPTTHMGFAAEVEQLIAERVLPGIHRDGGDLQLVSVSDDGLVKVRLHGACRSCPSSQVTLHHGVESALKEAFPGRVTAVQAVE